MSTKAPEMHHGLRPQLPAAAICTLAAALLFSLMTVTPVPGTFTIRKKDAYLFSDTQDRSIPLPGKPYLAVRIERVNR